MASTTKLDRPIESRRLGSQRRSTRRTKIPPKYNGPYEKLIFDKSRPGQIGISLPENEFGEALPEAVAQQGDLRDEVPLPEVSEPEVIRHFTRLSRQNFSIDTHFYPLGSCTMKYNPRINEEMASNPDFRELHPLAGEAASQGALKVIAKLRERLLELTGFADVTLQPAAGAQGEMVGMLMIHACHQAKGEHGRRKVLIPDSAHGTNPATCTIAGLEAVQIPSGPDGLVDMEAFKKHLGPDLAGIMLTNPNTLGLFERNIQEISRLVHEHGGLVYCDGANLNALVGSARPGDMGIDVMHMNLHKTFSTPHGGGGPGAGAVGVSDRLEDFLPTPVLVEEDGHLSWDEDRPHSIGRVMGFNGNFLILLRALTYILELGTEGARDVSQGAVLKANYIRVNLKDTYHLAYDQVCMHECIFNDKRQARFGVGTMDIAKRLIDHDFHPPTVYFPLVVPGALMIEPTETESKETLDLFIAAMKKIAKEAEETPEKLLQAPKRVEYLRLDEVYAARQQELNHFTDRFEKPTA